MINGCSWITVLASFLFVVLHLAEFENDVLIQSSIHLVIDFRL